jgi:FKBP-type peptidyl-prolyl isomerase-like protein
MSDGVKSRERSRPTGKAHPAKPASARQTKPASTKAQRRAAFKAAQAAAARRRRQLKIGALTGGLALIVIVVSYLVVSGNDKPTSATISSPCGSVAFPPVPADADPALCTKPTVGKGAGEVTELKITTLVKGKGAAATSGQTISVNYVGVSYKSGAEFDASWKRRQPFSFQLGAGGVIQGWDQGLAGVTVGSRVQLDIPSTLAYGDNPGGGRPGGALRFVVDLLAVG